MRVDFEGHQKGRPEQMVLGLASILQNFDLTITNGELEKFSLKKKFLRFSLGNGGTGRANGVDYVSQKIRKNKSLIYIT